MAAAHRTVVHEKQFTRELRQIEPNPYRANEIIEASEWVLSRNPYEGIQLAPRSPVWFLPIDLPGKQLGLYYTFDDETVYFLSISISPP